MKFRFLFLIGGTVSSLFSAVNDLIPSDYEAPLLNTTVMSLNYLTKELKPIGLVKDQYIKQNTYALRYSHTFDINGKELALGFATPFNDLKTHGEPLSTYIGEKSSGLSDIVLSSTYWLISDRKNKDFLGLTMTIYTPTGKYNESQILNAGENRYKTTLAMGYITKLTDTILLELSPEIGFYGDNETDKYKIEQENSYALSSNLRYKPSSSYEFFVGFQENYQGETVRNETKQNNSCFFQKYSLGGAYYVNKSNQLMIRMSKESDKEYGFEVDDEILLRYRWWF